jgi:DNA topoisomerase VI subunit B
MRLRPWNDHTAVTNEARRAAFPHRLCKAANQHSKALYVQEAGMNAPISRVAFETSRELEFFTEKELTLQIGVESQRWPLALLKELVDNALDACEAVGVPPAIHVDVTDTSISVMDNGPGLPEDVLIRSLDYRTRVSSNAGYVSPSRGQLGNAFKCLWAAGFVLHGSYGRIDIETTGQRQVIEVRLDHIGQKPVITRTVEGSLVKIGTKITLYLPELACLHSSTETGDFYNVLDLISDYAAFNPHARFVLTRPSQDSLEVAPVDISWNKWRTADPTSAHWYNDRRLRDLIGKYLHRGGSLTVREFVSQFRGLSGSAKQKKVTEMAQLSGNTLVDLVSGQDIDRIKVARLLRAMREHSNPIKPEQLGVLGKQHLGEWMSSWIPGAKPESYQYHCVKGFDYQGLPYVLEVGFAIKASANLMLVNGINFTALLEDPVYDLRSQLNQCRVDSRDPVVVVVHFACPRVQFTDRGKSRASLPSDVLNSVRNALTAVTKQWGKIKRQADRDGVARQRSIDAAVKAARRPQQSVKSAAYAVMEQAYQLASANGTLPANARQVMYAARPLILDMTGKDSLDDVYFTQTLLPGFVAEYPKETAGWDVVFDDRGHFHEPHTGRSIGLGTLAVRQYIETWQPPAVSAMDGRILLSKEVVTTCGAQGRYRFVLFIEKEGFMPLLKRARVAERYDIAIMSSKGMSTTATRMLVEALAIQGVIILAAHDFDKAGLTILHTLQHDTRRYQFKTKPLIIDLGLRLDDIEAMQLQSEIVTYDSDKDPRELLRQQGATVKEANFLVESGRPKEWRGRRVELNAMTAEGFLQWLERKFAEIGVSKMLPDAAVVEAAYRRGAMLHRAQEVLDKLIKKSHTIPLPAGLYQQIQSQLTEFHSWDAVVAEVAAMGHKS